MSCKANASEKAQRMCEYVSILREYLTKQIAFCVSPDNGFAVYPLVCAACFLMLSLIVLRRAWAYNSDSFLFSLVSQWLLRAYHSAGMTV